MGIACKEERDRAIASVRTSGMIGRLPLHSPRHRRAAVAGRGAAGGDSDARRVEHHADAAAHGLGRQVAKELGADGATAKQKGTGSLEGRGMDAVSPERPAGGQGETEMETFE